VKELTKSKEQWDKVVAANIAPNLELGRFYSESMLHDPKHVLFNLSRYKFCAKMLPDRARILEVGCGEGIGALLFLTNTGAKYTGVDLDEDQIAYAVKNVQPHGPDRLQFLCKDIITEPLEADRYDGLVCLDVIEHIAPDEEERFFANALLALRAGGVAIFGTPNIHAAAYANEKSRIGHINMYDPDRLVKKMRERFSHVFLFCMNDEVVHTGFSKMAHYLMVLCIK
jgi:2-polyprenyl-3-methyl-5-hydroxy-6-metoxy-1,4-benzoquinol methylase